MTCSDLGAGIVEEQRGDDRGTGTGRDLHRKAGLSATYLFDCLSFLVSLIALASIRKIPPADAELSPGLGAIAEGLNYARSRPELIGTYLVDIVAMMFAMLWRSSRDGRALGGAEAAGCSIQRCNGQPRGVAVQRVDVEGEPARRGRDPRGGDLGVRLWAGFAPNLATR